MVFIAFCESLLSLSCGLNFNISFPFKIQDLVSMIEPHCYCRILVSEIESINFYEPKVPCEVADFRQVIQETLNGFENVSVLYTKPRRFLNLKYTCVLNIYYIGDQVGLDNYLMSSSLPVYNKNNTKYFQKRSYIFHLLRYLNFIAINVGNDNRLLKLEMRLQYTFLVVRKDKRIKSYSEYFTRIFGNCLRTIWFSAVIALPEENYSRNNFQNTVDNVTVFLCVPHRTDYRYGGYYCEAVSFLSLQIVVNLRNKNITPSCVFRTGPQEDVFRLLVNGTSKTRSNENTLFKFLSLLREKKYNTALFVQHAANVDLWQHPNGMKEIDIYMVVEICAQLNYSANQDTFTELYTFVEIDPPIVFAEFSDELDYLFENKVDYGNSAGLQHEDYWALSCYRIPILSFLIYTIPFDKNLWISLPITLFITLLTLKVYTKIPVRNAFSFCLFLYSSLVNNCTSVPATFSKIKILRVIWIPWILMCIIVNNCYVSILVSYINVPHSGEPFTNISQVLCKENDGMKVFEAYDSPFEITNETTALRSLLHLYHDMDNRIIIGRSSRKIRKQNQDKAINFWKPTLQFSLLYSIFQSDSSLKAEVQEVNHLHDRSGGTGYLEKLKKLQNDDSCFSLLSPPLNPGLDTFRPSPHGYEVLNVILAGLTESESDQEDYLAKFVQPKQRHYPKFQSILQKPVAALTQVINNNSIFVEKYHPFIREAAIEDELTECGKSVYISATESVKDELDYLRTNYPTLNFYRSKHSIFKRITGWNFPPLQMLLSKLPKRIQAYYAETGIYHHLNRQTRMSSLINRRKYTSIINKAKKVSAIKLTKPLQTVFIIILVGLLITVVVFGFELFICQYIPLYFPNCRHLFCLSFRVLRRSFALKK